MAFCGKCGNQVSDDVRFCPACGAEIASQQQAQGGYQQASYQRPASSEDNDVNQNKGMAILAYFGPLAFIPYFAAKDSPFARFHGAQGLNLFILEAIFGVAAALLSYLFLWISWGLYIAFNVIVWLGWIGFTVVVVFGIVNAASGKKKPVPVLGGIRFVKE